MRKALALILGIVTICIPALSQETSTQQNQQPDDVIRITTQLVQVDAVITDKNDQVIPDLKLSDFSVYENGKKQDVQFLEFVAAGTTPRVEGQTNIAREAVNSATMANVSAQTLHRVFAFVIDDLTIPLDEMVNVRSMLTDFVNTKMRDDDLVAIVRVVAGRGLLEQFTSDKPLLRRAISELTITPSPYSVSGNLTTPERLDKKPVAAGASTGEIGSGPSGAGNPEIFASVGNDMNYETSPDGYTNGMRALAALTVTGDVIDSMKSLPGRKSLVLVSGGLPAFEASRQQLEIKGAILSVPETRSLSSSVSYLMNRLADRASRAGVVINTMDIRGLRAVKGVSGFNDPGNEGKSGLLGGMLSGPDTGGRTADMAMFDNLAMDPLMGHLGLDSLAAATGGVSVSNSNNFLEGLDRMLARSSYYLIGYRPSENFDGKFHKLQVKVDRPGAKVYSRLGYVAVADQPSVQTLTREQIVIKAAMSPLAKQDIDITGALQYRFTNDNRAAIDVNLRVDPAKLDLKQEADGKYHANLDIVGFVLGRTGKAEQGFSETINAALSPDEYKRALAAGIGYTGRVELAPGSYQLRVAVRDESSARVGSLSKYVEIPDMSKKRLNASSVFLHAIEPGKKEPVALTALRQITRNDDLRYSVFIYNPKLDHGKPELAAQLIIARGEKIVFNQPVQALEVNVAKDGSQVAKIGQIGLGKLPTGHYTLTLIITDKLADSKTQTIGRSIDFTVTD